MVCTRCGAKNNDNAVFCMNCGVKIGSGVRIFHDHSTVAATIRTKSPVIIILGLIFAIFTPIIGIILGIVGQFYYSTKMQKIKSQYNIIVGCALLFARLILTILIFILIVVIAGLIVLLLLLFAFI